MPNPPQNTSASIPQGLIDAVNTDLATLQSATNYRLQTNSALVAAQGMYQMAVMNLAMVQNGGTQAQIDTAAAQVLAMNVSLTNARAADDMAAASVILAQNTLDNDRAALVAAINNLP